LQITEVNIMADILNAQPINISKVKEVITIGGLRFLALLEEETDDKYIFNGPFTIEEIINPMSGQVALGLKPLSLINPNMTIKLRKELVLAVNNVPAELEQAYYNTKLQLNSAATQSNNNSANSKILKIQS